MEGKAEELVRRLAAAVRGSELYSPTHPLVRRGVEALTSAATEALQSVPSVVVGFIGDDVVVETLRLPRGTAALTSFARDLREREIDKITLSRGLTADDIRGLIAALGDRSSPQPVADRLAARGVRHVALGKIVDRRCRRRALGDRRGTARLRHGRRDGGESVERRQGRRPAGPRRRPEDHRQPREAGRRIARRSWR